MCGLVGVAGNLTQKTSKAFRMLLIVDQIRGFHSTGVVRVGFNKHQKVDLHKELGPPNELFDKSNLFDRKGVPNSPSRIWLGHNRYATAGAITKDNAHPFNFGDVYGMHNGTLDDYDKLHGADTYPVDSMALLSNISKFGIHDTWSKFHGAAAVTWYDQTNDTLNLIRNKRRPLHVAYSESGDVLFWASEAWMIRAAAESADINLRIDENTGDDVLSLQENVLHQYATTTTTVKLVKVEEVEEAKYPRPFLQQNRYGYGGWQQSSQKSSFKGGSQTTKKEKTSSQQKTPLKTSRVLSNSSIIIPPDLRKNLNASWAEGREKADKGVLGLKFKTTTVSRIYRPTKTDLFCIKGSALGDFNGKRVDIMLLPSSAKDWEKWCDYANKLKFSDNVYVLRQRPRIYSENAHKVTFGFSSQSVELFSGLQMAEEKYKEEPEPDKDITYLVRGRDGNLVTKAEFLEQVDDAGNCSMCAQPIHPSDASKCHWHNKTTVCCPDCRYDELWQEYTGGVTYGRA